MTRGAHSRPEALAGQRVLVTGASGFIGSHLAIRLAGLGARARGMVRSPDKGAWLAARGVQVVEGDLTNPESLRRAARKCHIVFSVAGWVSGRDRARARRVNVDGIRALAEAAVEAGARRFVHTSSIAAYGLHAAGVVDETWPLQAEDAYGASKAEGESVVGLFSDRIEISIIRPAQVYGPRGGTWTLGLFDLARRGLPALIGGGGGSFHPCYVDNLIDAFLLAASCPDAVGQAFNVVDGVTTWRDFVGFYARMAGRPARSVPLWLIQLALIPVQAGFKLAGRPSPIPPGGLAFVTGACRFSSAKAARRLGWTPAVSLAEGMRRTEAWLRDSGRLGARLDRV